MTRFWSRLKAWRSHSRPQAVPAGTTRPPAPVAQPPAPVAQPPAPVAQPPAPVPRTRVRAVLTGGGTVALDDDARVRYLADRLMSAPRDDEGAGPGKG